MPTLTNAQIAELIAPFYRQAPDDLLAQLSTYLDLLVKWNARTNLTAIREPEEMVRRHFGESLFAARHLPVKAETLLDLGSGAGFPGLPIQLARPQLTVTLAESQNKKATFLREAVRTLGLPTEVWGARAETLPAERRFDVVTLRAVDDPAKSLVLARRFLSAQGTVAHLTASEDGGSAFREEFAVPGSDRAVLRLLR